MRSPLTPKQQRCLDWIESYIDENRRSPTIREIAKGIGYKSSAPVQSLLYHLREKEWLDWMDGQSRTIWLLSEPDTAEVLLDSEVAIALLAARARWRSQKLSFNKELIKRLAA